MIILAFIVIMGAMGYTPAAALGVVIAALAATGDPRTAARAVLGS